MRSILFLLATAGLVSAVGEPISNNGCSGQSVEKLINCNEIMSGFAKGQTRIKVIVNLVEPAQIRAKTDWKSKSSLKQLYDKIKAIQAPVLSSLSANEFTPRHCFDNQAGFSGEITLAGLEKLKNNPLVQSIEPVYLLEPHLRQGISLMQANTYRSSFNGDGTAIAICDTGIDYSHPMLGGGGFPNSKVIGGYDFGSTPNDSDPMPVGEAHGTACAGIAAGNLGSTGDYIGGVAYNAKLYALKITADSSGSANSDDMAAAWDWCVSHKNDNTSYPIMVISTSFGGGRNYSTCDSYYNAMTNAAANAVAAGITVLASSGNDGYCDSIAWPSCISSVISVGAVYDAALGNIGFCIDAASCGGQSYTSCQPSSSWACFNNSVADMVTCYSNTANFLTILAPSHNAYTTDIAGSGGYSSGDYDSTFGGTSAACPYAAGAVACLQSAAMAARGSYLSPSEVETVLTSTGDNITDGKVAITKPRVNLQQAIDSMAPAPPGQATNPNPAASATGVSTNPTLSWTAGSGAISHDVYFGTASPGTFIGNQSAATYTPGILASNTTYYWRIDEKNSYGTTTGNVWSFTTLLDTSPPTPNPMAWVTVPTATGSTSITMTAATAADNATPPVMYYFECTTDGSKSSLWQTSTTYTVSGLTPGTLYSFRVKARDSAPVQNETGWSTTQSVTMPLFSDGFESGNFTAGGWAVTGSADVSTSAKNTGAYGARLPATKNSTSSIQKNLSTVGFTTIHILYDRENTNANQTLFVEWSIDGAAWYNLETTSSTAWASQNFTCPSGADNNSGFRVRFSAASTSNPSRYSYIDNVQITGDPIPPPPQHTLTVTAVGNGTIITPGVGLFSYNYGTVVNLTAAPQANHHFVNWTGSGVAAGKVVNPNSAATTITMDGDYTVAANFAIDQYAVGGTITSNGTGLDGVTMTGLPGNPVTSGGGLYSVPVNYGWSGTVTPTKAGYTFAPDSITYNNVAENHPADNYTAVLNRYVISGYVKNQCDIPISGVLLDANDQSISAITDANGRYEIGVDYNWSGTITPAKQDYTFEPGGISYVGVLGNIADGNYVGQNIYDLDCNGDINMGDLAVMSSNWLMTGTSIPGDLNNDQIVNFLDFAIFAEQEFVLPAP